VTGRAPLRAGIWIFLKTDEAGLSSCPAILALSSARYFWLSSTGDSGAAGALCVAADTVEKRPNAAQRAPVKVKGFTLPPMFYPSVTVERGIGREQAPSAALALGGLRAR
jgi:hypothetical protein